MRREEQSRDTFTSLQLRAHAPMDTHTKGSITGLQSQAAMRLNEACLPQINCAPLIFN